MQAAPPQVVSTHPRVGNLEVSAGAMEIAVTFDQDMEPGGFSFIGGGATFPELAGKPFWESARECRLPVRLAPGRSYTVGINSATKANFKGSNGAPATPFVLEFTTLPAGGAIPRETQMASGRQLREAIEQHYSYLDVHLVDWKTAWKEFAPRLIAAKSARAFAVIAGEMLAATEDPHIWLVEGGEIVPAFRRSVRPNVNPEWLSKHIVGWSRPHPALAFGKAAPGIGYIAIDSWEKQHQPTLLEAAFAALAELRDLPALIIDVRRNTGGDEVAARAFAGSFVRERAVYARHATIDHDAPGGFAEPVERTVEPTAGKPRYEGRVAVLMGPANMSSAEAFLLMMRQAPDCRLIGGRSYGSSGNPQPHLLANGVTVYLPSWKAVFPDGTMLETKGVAPDVEITATPGELGKRDPVIENAIEQLKR